MKALELLIETLDPFSIYHAIDGIASTVFTTITPVLLVIAVAVRTLETQLDATHSLGKWERAIRDFFLFGLLIGAYFGIMTLLNTFLNEVYLLTDTLGNYKALSRQLEALLEKSIAGSPEKWTLNKLAQKIDISPYGITMTFLYWVSNLFVSTAYIFFKGAYAILYAFVFIYGLIALPMSVSKSLKLMKGWALLLGALMLWPILESVFMGFFGQMFSGAAEHVISKTTFLMNPTGTYSDFRAFFAVINVVLGFLIMLAPVVAAALVANANSMFPMVAPFASGVLAVAGGAMLAGKSALPGSRMMGGIGAAAGLLSAKNGGGEKGFPGSGFSAGSSFGGLTNSGGPSPKSANPKNDGGGTAGNGASDRASGGAGDIGSSEGPTARTDEGTEAEQEAKKAKRRKAKTGHLVNAHRKKSGSSRGKI